MGSISVHKLPRNFSYYSGQQIFCFMKRRREQEWSWCYIFLLSHTHTQRKKYLCHALPGLYNFPHGTACSRRFLFLSLASSSHPLSLQQVLIMFDGWCSCPLDFLTRRFRGQMMNLSELPAILNSWASKAGVSNSFSPGHHVSLEFVFESNQRDT